MKINFQRTDDCIKQERKAKKCMYGAVNNGQWWTRLTGMPLGVASGTLTITARVGTIAECLFKGAANIVDSIQLRNSKLLRYGLKQLFLSSTKSVIILPFSIFSAATGMVTNSVFMLFFPKWHANKCIRKQSRAARLRYKIDKKIDNHLKAVLPTRSGGKVAGLFTTPGNQNLAQSFRDPAVLLACRWPKISKEFARMASTEESCKKKNKAELYRAMAGAPPADGLEANAKTFITLERLHIKLVLTEMQAHAKQEETTYNEGIRQAIDTCLAHVNLAEQADLTAEEIKSLRGEYDALLETVQKADKTKHTKMAERIYNSRNKRMNNLRAITDLLIKTGPHKDDDA